MDLPDVLLVALFILYVFTLIDYRKVKAEREACELLLRAYREAVKDNLNWEQTEFLVDAAYFCFSSQESKLARALAKLDAVTLEAFQELKERNFHLYKTP